MIFDGLGTNFHVRLCIFGTQLYYLACLVASLGRPGAILGHCGAQDRTGKVGNESKEGKEMKQGTERNAGRE